jgi:predicted TPR repeat methyltransferase
MLIFSTEKLLGAAGLDYQLNISGRYSHHPDYLTELLGNAGFMLQQISDVTIRTESGCQIEGQFVCVNRDE